MFVLVISLGSFLIFLLIAEKLKWSKYWEIIIKVVLGMIVIPLASSEVTGFNLNDTINDLKDQIQSQETILNDISNKIITAMNDECLKDLAERRKIIHKLHDKSFKIAKQDYDNIVDSVFDELEEYERQKNALESEQKKLSDESLIYFEALVNHILNEIDNISDQFDKRGSLLGVEKEEVTWDFLNRDDKSLVIGRKISLKNNRKIEVMVYSRDMEKNKLRGLPYITIAGYNRRTNFVFAIKGPKIKEKKLGGKGGLTMEAVKPIEDITYQLGEDPLLNESFRKAIDERLKLFLKNLLSN